MSGGDSGTGGVNKLATALIIIFAISLLALLAELFYVICRRRVFRREANPVRGGGDEISQISSTGSTFSSVAPSKDLLCFLCVRSPKIHIECNSATANSEANGLNSDRQQTEMEVNIDIDLLKIQGMFGPPRFLYTIKEDEKEDLESPPDKSLCAGSMRRGEREIDGAKGCSVSLGEHFKEAGIDDATPFSTPCSSPSYFTPSGSPIHEVVNGEKNGLLASA